jgi:hypothetical protein
VELERGARCILLRVQVTLRGTQSIFHSGTVGHWPQTGREADIWRTGEKPVEIEAAYMSNIERYAWNILEGVKADDGASL